MLYIDDTDGSHWLDTLEALSERGVFDMVLRLYPDAEADSFPEPFTTAVVPEPLEEVDEFPQQGDLPCSSRVRISPEMIDALRTQVGEFEDWGDSLTLYPANAITWVAAFMPQSRIVLVRDIQLYGFLEAAGVPVRLEPPQDW